jgi:hypothetical protein
VVDVLAIRKDTSQPKETLLNRGDLFDIVLIQVKGGGARPPTKADCIRLRTVARRYNAGAVVLFQWRKGQAADFFRLNRHLEWVPTTSRELFEYRLTRRCNRLAVPRHRFLAGPVNQRRLARLAR